MKHDASDEYDVIVVGAGPAGAIAARQAALQGLHTLLVDKAAFPRGKVCGGCLNHHAIGTLRRIGLPTLLDDLHAQPIHRLQVYRRELSAGVDLPAGVCVSRYAFDEALIRAAVDAGVEFASQRRARWGLGETPHRRLELTGPDGVRCVTASVVIAATGLASTLLDGHIEARVEPHSHMGIGATAEPNRDLADDAIHMAVGDEGYVGVARQEDGMLNLAAALSPGYIKRSGGPADAVRRIMHEAGLPRLQLASTWQGTPTLTRTRRPAAHRLLLIGDAAGYVEPFTGEGMSWAIDSGIAAASLVSQLRDGGTLTHWDAQIEQRWATWRNVHLRPRQRKCRWVASTLRRRWMTLAAIYAARLAPSLAARIASGICAPPTMGTQL